MSDEHAGPSELIRYQTEDNRMRIEVRLDGGTVWLQQASVDADHGSRNWTPFPKT